MTEQSKKCRLCEAVFYREDLHKDWAWEQKDYCEYECRLIVSHMRGIMRSGHFKKAYAIVAQEIINSKKQNEITTNKGY